MESIFLAFCIIDRFSQNFFIIFHVSLAIEQAILGMIYGDLGFDPSRALQGRMKLCSEIMEKQLPENKHLFIKMIRTHEKCKEMTEFQTV